MINTFDKEYEKFGHCLTIKQDKAHELINAVEAAFSGFDISSKCTEILETDGLRFSIVFTNEHLLLMTIPLDKPTVPTDSVVYSLFGPEPERGMIAADVMKITSLATVLKEIFISLENEKMKNSAAIAKMGIELGRLFDNHFDCYAAVSKQGKQIDENIPAVTKAKFIEVGMSVLPSIAMEDPLEFLRTNAIRMLTDDQMRTLVDSLSERLPAALQPALEPLDKA